MDGGTGGPADEMLSPGEAEWPPELRLPPPPPMPEPAPRARRSEPSPSHSLAAPPPAVPCPRPPTWMQPLAAAVPKMEPSPPPRRTEGFDDSHFLGSIMEAAAPPQQPQQQPAAAAAAAEAPVVVKRKRGRPPKNRDGVVAAPAPPKPVKMTEDEEVVCFICFDGGDLVVCDRRGCPKVYHPACIKRDESFFRSRGKWNCGWHLCSSCEKAVQYMCYTCTYSLCKGCIKQGKFFGVRGNKGFCDTCYGTILLIESKDEDNGKVRVDFDDKNSWEYLFKLYWVDLKGKHLLTLEELISAKSRWTVQSTSARREKEESSDELYDANNDHDASSDSSSRKRQRNTSSGRRGRKRQKDGGTTAGKCGIAIKGAGSLPKSVPSEGMNLSGDMKWASPELLEFIGHMRNGDRSYISQFDVQVLLLDYIKQNNLRDPRRKSQIICDARLSNLFKKPRVGHFEMLKLLEMHFHVKETTTVNGDSQRFLDPDSAHVDSGGFSEMATKLCSDKRRKIHKKIERVPPVNLEGYAAIDMHNINLIYLRRSLMEDLIDDGATFSEKITGAFVRIKISGVGQKQDMYRLVKVLGIHKVAERYSVGKKTTDCALEISNLDKKEVIAMDTISNQDFTEEECKRLRQSMKYGLITRLKVGDIHEKAKIFQSLRVNDWLENEKQRLSHLRDRASETGRRKELRDCVEKLQILNTPEERVRRINEVPEVHVDPHMDPNYESAEERDYIKAVDWTMNRNGSDLLFPGKYGAESNSVQNQTQKCFDASRHISASLPTEDVTHKPGAESNINFQSANGWNIPQPRIDLNNTVGEAASLSSSGVVSSDMEPEKVWHYKDPSGNVQGPFTLSQLSKWKSYFPRDLRIWLTFESEENSLLMTEVLSKQPKDFIQPTSVINNTTWAGTGKDRSNSSMDENNTSPIGFSIVYSSGLPSQCDNSSPPTREGPILLGGTLPSRTSWEPLKNAQTSCQAQHQANYPYTIPSSAGSSGLPGSHDEGVPRENIGEWNNRQDSGGMWSPTTPHKSDSCLSNVEPHPDGYTTKKQLQNDSKSNSLARSVENLNLQMNFGSQKVLIPTPQQSERDLATSLGTSSPSEFTTTAHKSQSYQSIMEHYPDRCTTKKQLQDDSKNNSQAGYVENLDLQMDFRSQKVPIPTPQQSERDLATSLGTTSPCEFKTARWQEGSYWSSTTNPTSPDEIQFSIVSAKPVSSSPTNPVEDRDSSSTSGMPRQSGDPPCCPQSVPSACISNSSKTKETMNQHKTCDPDALNAPVKQPPEPKIDPVLSSGTQDPECKYPSPTPKIDRKEPSVEQSGSTSVTPEAAATQAYDHSSIAFVSETFGAPAGKIVSLQSLKETLQSLKETLCPEERVLKNGGSITQTDHMKEETTAVKRGNIIVSPVSDAEALAVSDVLESSTEQKCGTYTMHGATPLENFTPASAEEEQPQCFSPIALSPWGEPSYYQGEAVDSALWGVQDDPSNDMWSLSSPTPALQPSSGLGADGKDTSCIIEEVIVAQGNSAVIEMPPTPEEKRLEKGNLSASIGCGVSEQVKSKPSAASSSSLEGSTKSSGSQLSGSSLGGCTKASGLQLSGSFLDGGTKASGGHLSGSPLEGSSKASGLQLSGSFLEGSTKAAGWQPSRSSLELSAKASGWQPSGSSEEQSTKTSGWQPSGSSIEGSTKASGCQRSSSSPEGSRKASGWHSSAREGTKVNSSSASQNRNSSSSHQTATPTAKNSSETPRRQGNTNTNTSGWGEALGNNKSWSSSSGNASRGSQTSHHHDRHSQGNESRRGSSNHSRRSDHRQDHGSGGSSRSLSRGQSQRGICKFYENGFCKKGSSCHYLHR